jgi:hypothetical protein
VELSPLEGMPLEQLSIGVNSRTDLSPLRAMPLQKLGLGMGHEGGPPDLSPLEDLHLQELRLSGWPKKDLTALRCLRYVKTLYISPWTQSITSLDGLENMVDLQTLSVGSDAAMDINALRGLRKLTRINFTNAHGTKGPGVLDMAPLKELRLVELGLPPYWRGDVTPLTRMSLLGTSGGAFLPYGNPSVPINAVRGAMTMNVVTAWRQNGYSAAAMLARRYIDDFAESKAFAPAIAMEYLAPMLDGLAKNPKAIPENAKEYGGHHYLHWRWPLTWEEAREFSEMLGGHLVVPVGESERKFLEEQKWFASYHSSPWIGARKGESGHEWITGETWERGIPRLKENGVAFARQSQEGTLCFAVVGDRACRRACRGLVVEWDR